MPLSSFLFNIKDDFLRANLSAKVHWTGFEPLVALLFFVGILYSIFGIHKEKPMRRYVGIFLSICFFESALAYVFAPKIQDYIQGAAIAFYKEKSHENCYIMTYGFKSFAQYFYGRHAEYRDDIEALLSRNKIDKNIYIVTKSYAAKKLIAQYPTLQFLYEENGFVFFKREKTKNAADI